MRVEIDVDVGLSDLHLQVRTPSRPFMASPRRRALRIPDGPGVADGEANEKYVEYMKAVRLVQQRARVEAKAKAEAEAIQGGATSSPAPSKAAGIGQTSASAAKVPRTPTGGNSTPLKSSGGRGPAVRGSSASLPVSGGQARRVPQGSLAARPDSPGSDSSDSIDFEVRAIGHVRSVKKPGSTAATPSRPVSDSVAREIRDLQRYERASAGALTNPRLLTSSRAGCFCSHLSLPACTYDLLALYAGRVWSLKSLMRPLVASTQRVAEVSSRGPGRIDAKPWQDGEG